MARTKKKAQSKQKKQNTESQQEHAEPDGDAMDLGDAAPADVMVERDEDANEGADGGAEKLSIGKLKKKQRWEQKLLKVKVGNLKKERLKLGKKKPEHKADRKALTKQMKAMVAEQQKAHADERQKGLETT